jgi:hypothetical protein
MVFLEMLQYLLIAFVLQVVSVFIFIALQIQFRKFSLVQAVYAGHVMGVRPSGTALVPSFAAIAVTGWHGALGDRGFNRLSKYTLDMGNGTSSNITNGTDIAKLMS